MEAGTSGTKAQQGEGKTALDYLSAALDHLKKAGDEASGEVKEGIDAAVKEVRDAYEDTSSRAKHRAEDWQKTLEQAAEDARRELAKLAVKAQGSPEALDELEREIADRREHIAAGK